MDAGFLRALAAPKAALASGLAGGLVLAIGESVAPTATDPTVMMYSLAAAGAQQVREVSAACNEPKAASIVWLVGETRALQITPAGFKATVKRIGTGTTTVQVNFEGRSKVWSVQ